MAEISKLQERIMGEYSIAKSYKGILRIAHIKDMGDNKDDYATDELLNPTFYGTPSELIDISGKESATSAAGYANAIKALSGGLKRYNRFVNDKLRLNRVPVTDSMGNYINWNIGFDGVTIGSNELINGYDHSNTTISGVTFQRLFPVLKTNNITVGMKKMLLGTAKGAVNQSHVDLEGASQTPMLVVQNFYDKSDVNKTYVDEIDFDSSGKNYDKVTSKYFKFNDTSSNGINEYRTVYTNTKHVVEDYDVFMYNQDNHDIIDGVHYAKVDIVNLKEYVKKLISKFKKGNVIEVPTGAVIWQYCSLDKWRAETETVDGNSIELVAGTGFPGHRPSMQMRENSSSNNKGNPFFNTLVQGACRKQTYISAPTQLAKSSKKESSDNSDMSIKENDKTLLNELIPLYKRDYVLCDGSVYRIPYLPKNFSSNLSELMVNRSRFFELFFNLGYKYTSRDKMISRHLSVMDSNDGVYYLVNENNEMISDELYHETDYAKNSYETSAHKSFTKLTSGRKTELWSGQGTPKFVDVTNEIFDNCDDIDVLFQEDLATMLCCDEIYRFVRKRESDKLGTPTRKEIIDHLKATKLPEEYIFNSYIGDTKNDISNYSLNSFTNNKDTLNVIELTYHGTTQQDDVKPKLLLGREVNSYNSLMKFYDTTQKTYVNARVYELPLVTYFIQMILSSKGIDIRLVPYLYTFFNYDFQVPHFIVNDRTPTFIGSGAYLFSNNFRKSINKAQSWSCNYDCNFMPHRHYIALSKFNDIKDKDEETTSSPYVYEGFNNLPVWDNNDPQNSPYYSSSELSSSNSLLAEVCKGKLDICKGALRGWSRIATDNSCSYILRDIEITVKSSIRNGIPVLIAQSKNNEIPDIKTGIDYRINGDDETLLNENFTYSDGDYKGYYEYHKDKWFSFVMGKDDPRFENAEPNRGLSATKSHEGFHFDDQKITKNLSNWYKTTATTYFSMENITMLPIIKL